MSGHDPTSQAAARRGAEIVRAAVAATRAPQGLRERVAAQQAAIAPARRRRRVRALGGALAGAAGAVALAIVLAGGGAAPKPTVLEASRLGLLAPQAPAPREHPRNGDLLDVSVGGVAFPDWGGKLRWPATGARTDRLAGRLARTVYYEARGVVAAYTIVGGSPLEPPAGARQSVVEGTRLWWMRRGGRWVITWRRGGHTCVMTAPEAADPERLLWLAAWESGERA